MGMFDEITCDYPLPDGFTGRLVYQTKDTDRQQLDMYTITADGFLTVDGARVDHHGRIEFYWSNVSGTNGRGGYITSDDKPARCRAYVALFDHGTLLKIEGGLVADFFKDMRHVTREEFWKPKSEQP